MLIKIENVVRKLSVLAVVLVLGFVVYSSATAPGPPRYCGKVTQVFRTDAGYKSTPRAYVVFYSDSLKRNVAVDVSWNTYANAVVGNDICFRLYEYQLKE